MTYEQFYFHLKGYLLAKQSLTEEDVNTILDIMAEVKNYTAPVVPIQPPKWNPPVYGGSGTINI